MADVVAQSLSHTEAGGLIVFTNFIALTKNKANQVFAMGTQSIFLRNLFSENVSAMPKILYALIITKNNSRKC